MSKIRCVYKITNTANGRCYIGSTEDFTQRKWRHFYDLRHERHCSRFMQRDFSKCGRSHFEIEIIENVDVGCDLIEREQYWLDAVKPHYNSAKVAGSPAGVKHSAEAVRRNKERNTGFGNGNARITEAQAEEIRRLIPVMSGEKIAAKFGVHKETVRRVCRRIGVAKKDRIYDAQAREKLSTHAKNRISGSNAMPVFMLREGDENVICVKSITAASRVVGVDVSALAKRLKVGGLIHYKGFCISKSRFDAAMVAWPYRRGCT